MTFINNPFFWALVSMFGLVGACAVVGSRRIGSRPLIGWIIVLLFFDLGRVLLALPSIEQPRFEMGGWHSLVGGAIFIVGLVNVIFKGLPITCGCVGEAGEPVTWWKVLKNTGMLVMAIQIFFYDRLFVLDRGGFIWRERKI